MTYLELLQDTAKKVGIPEPSATTGLSGESERLLDYVDEAWLEIQNLYQNWQWMWTRGSFTTTASKRDYTPAEMSITNINWIAPYGAAIYETGDVSTESRIKVTPYPEYRARYDIGTQEEDRPTKLTVLPNRSVRLHPTPDSTGFTVEFDYYAKPSSLSGDSDTPEIPNADLHRIIVWRAAMSWAQYEESAEAFAFAQSNYNRYLTRLRKEERPDPAIRLIPLANSPRRYYPFR